MSTSEAMRYFDTSRMKMQDEGICSGRRTHMRTTIPSFCSMKISPTVPVDSDIMTSSRRSTEARVSRASSELLRPVGPTERCKSGEGSADISSKSARALLSPELCCKTLLECVCTQREQHYRSTAAAEACTGHPRCARASNHAHTRGAGVGEGGEESQACSRRGCTAPAAPGAISQGIVLN